MSSSHVLVIEGSSVDSLDIRRQLGTILPVKIDASELKDSKVLEAQKAGLNIFDLKRERLPCQRNFAGKQTYLVNREKGPSQAIEFLSRIPDFSQLSELALSRLAAHSQFVNVLASQYISFEGDKNERCFIVVSGRFAMTKSSPSGKELVVELLGPDDFFSLAIAMGKLHSDLAARAQSNSEILWIKTSDLDWVLEANPKLYKGFAEYLAHRLELSHDFSRGLAHDSVKVRIGSLMLGLISKYSRVRNDLTSQIIIDITRQQIADLTGTTPESAIRMTREMHNDGIINVSKPGIIRIVNIESLRNLAGGIS